MDNERFFITMTCYYYSFEICYLSNGTAGVGADALGGKKLNKEWVYSLRIYRNVDYWYCCCCSCVLQQISPDFDARTFTFTICFAFRLSIQIQHSIKIVDVKCVTKSLIKVADENANIRLFYRYTIDDAITLDEQKNQ